MSDRNLQKEFDRLVKDMFSLHFQPLGFQRKGAVYARVCDGEFIQMLSVEKDRANNAEGVGFTLTVSFSSGLDAFALPWHKERPVPLLVFRLERVAPGPAWYWLQQDVPFEETKAAFEQRLKGAVLPLFDTHRTAPSLLPVDRVLHQDGGRASHSLQRFMFLFHVGEQAAAAALLQTEYDYIQQSGDCFPPQALDAVACVAHRHQIHVADEAEVRQRLASHEAHLTKMAEDAARRRAAAKKVAPQVKSDYPFFWVAE